jgi:hypothetical protein
MRQSLRVTEYESIEIVSWAQHATKKSSWNVFKAG